MFEAVRAEDFDNLMEREMNLTTNPFRVPSVVMQLEDARHEIWIRH
jgi:hypothetical protein